VFLSSLKDEDVTETMFPTAKSILEPDQARPSRKLADKVNTICVALRRVFQCNDAEESKYLLCVITSLAVMQPPRLGEALSLIHSLEQQRARLATPHKGPNAEDALEYLAFLCDINQLYDVALGMYDLGLVRLVASKTQKDPKEYLPFIGQLEKLPVALRCHAIDMHLQRYASALNHLAKAGTERFPECLALMERHGLFREAMAIFGDDVEKQRPVMQNFARHLANRGRHEQAGILYDSCG
jgi:elongator complex protein 1